MFEGKEESICSLNNLHLLLTRFVWATEASFSCLKLMSQNSCAHSEVITKNSSSKTGSSLAEMRTQSIPIGQHSVNITIKKYESWPERRFIVWFDAHRQKKLHIRQYGFTKQVWTDKYVANALIDPTYGRLGICWILDPCRLVLQDYI
jgi:hypothetical protein